MIKTKREKALWEHLRDTTAILEYITKWCRLAGDEIRADKIPPTLNPEILREMQCQISANRYQLLGEKQP